VGRPTIEELRCDLRAIMETRADYRYEAYDTPAVRRVRIPQQEWADGAPSLGASGLPVADGVVRWFDAESGIGMITLDHANALDGSGGSGESGEGHDEVFFHFTAIPGEGYRTLRAGMHVRFEVVESAAGKAARNIRTTA